MFTVFYIARFFSHLHEADTRISLKHATISRSQQTDICCAINSAEFHRFGLKSFTVYYQHYIIYVSSLKAAR